MTTPADDPRALRLTRVFEAPPEAVWRAWTEAELLKQWFAPRPWSTPEATLDVRVGGTFHTRMVGPDGQGESGGSGVYLVVEPHRRLVFTDAFTTAWVPSQKAFMVVEIDLGPRADGRTDYAVTVRHWSAEDRDAHMAMGFDQGWGACADQLGELARTL